ncbi:MAG: hypothetical protein J0I20_10430 [Chloroflexi bacterium]|nr:hypothetical protein [Chloroflexota bacterium]OJV94496.1 MAG: hypothetical protein BGO39_22375 [Chloroflexi bacterium 54-19]
MSLRTLLPKIRNLFLYLLAISVLVGGAYNAILLLRNGLESFQPLQLEVAPPQSLTGNGTTNPNTNTNPSGRPGTTAPLTNRVVLVVVNGMGLNDTEALPALQTENVKLLSTGANLFTGPVQPQVPALVTLLTGTTYELSGGFTLNPAQPSLTAPTTTTQLGQFDNLFAAVKRSNFTTAFFGTNDWFNAVPPDLLDAYTAFDPRQPASDIVGRALDFIKKKSANFTVVQLNSVNRAQTDYGYNSNQAIQARQDLNNALAKLVGGDLDLHSTALLITGDFDESVKAGDRWTVPLVMLGQAVQPGDKIWGRQEDITSTIAALLGVEIPRHNQGQILGSLLAMPAIDRGEKYLALAEQQQALDIAYRNRLNLVLPLAVNDSQALDAEKNVKVARQNYQSGSYDGIPTLVSAVVRYVHSDMQDASEEWFGAVRWQRAILAVVLLALPLLLLLIWRSPLALLAAGAALVAAVVPYGIYVLQGRSFDFNATSLAALLETAPWRAAIGVAVGLLIPTLFFDWTERRRIKRYGRIDLRYQQIADLRQDKFPVRRLFTCCALMLGWLAYFSGFVWFVWYYWRFGYFGPLVGQPALLPDTNSNFLEFFALGNLWGLAWAMLAAPPLLMGLYWIKRSFRGELLDKEVEIEEEELDILQQQRPGAEAGIIKL